MNILVSKNHQTLDTLGQYILNEYRNIRFLFEIDFSKDDYLMIKELFHKEHALQYTSFKDDIFIRYFRNNKNYRIPFLILLVGFVRYEYLNKENQANFFDNFLKHIIENTKADAKDFRKSLIDYFFRWRGNKEFDEEGLYIYDMQTSTEVSLKLEDSGKNKYLNSFIFHSGGVSEQDLKEYLKIIKYLSEESNDTSINKRYQDKTFNVYSKKIDNLFELLGSSSEISQYIQRFIEHSISIISKNKITDDFKLPLYIRNYLLFIGKYGDNLEKININETDFFYENETIVFSPKFSDSYRAIAKLSFKINNEIFNINKEYDTYTSKDFDVFTVPIENIEKIFTLELLFDGNIFKRYSIDFFQKEFILLDNEFNIKSIQNKEIYVPQKDEEKIYYIISKNHLNLTLSSKKIDNYLMYNLPLDTNISTINIGDEIYTLYFSPNILSDIQYEDNNDFIYTKELPRFRLTDRDKKRFKAINLFNNEELDYEKFYAYAEPIGKFEIQINHMYFKVIYIDGFEIIKWFNWYDKDKVLEVKLSSEYIKTNSDDIDEDDDSYTHTFNLKEENNTLVFNQLNGNNIHLEIQKPTIVMVFLDKRKTEIKIKSKNLKLEKLDFYRQLKIKLFNYPSTIKFNKFKIGTTEVDVIQHNNSYFLSLREVKELVSKFQGNHMSISLKNDYYFLPITDIIFDNKTSDSNEKIKINDIHFLMNNSENIKYYFDNRPYILDGFEIIETSTYRSEMLILKEARETRESKVIKKNFRNIKEDGLYVELKDIDYD